MKNLEHCSINRRKYHPEQHFIRSKTCLCYTSSYPKTQRYPFALLNKTLIFMLLLTIISFQVQTVSSASSGRISHWLRRHRRKTNWNSSPSHFKSILDNYYDDENTGDDDDNNNNDEYDNGERSSPPRTTDIFNKQIGDYKTCFKGGEYLEGYTLEGGTKAGKFTKLGAVESLEDCADLCCQDVGCKRAITLTSSHRKYCFRVDCYESQKCKPSSATYSSYKPSLFIRGTIADKNKKEATSEESKHSIITNDTMLDKDLPSLKRYKRGKAVCHKFTGRVCSEHVDQTKLYYFTSVNNTGLDKRLEHPISLLKSRLTGKCQTIAIQAICYRFYPQCNNNAAPKPINVCEDECDTILTGDCADEFQDSGMSKYLQRVIPNCIVNQNVDEEEDEQQNDKDCIKLQSKLPAVPTTSVVPLSTPRSSEKKLKPSLTLVNVSSTKDTETNFAESDSSAKSTSPTNTTLKPSTASNATAQNITTPTPQQTALTTLASSNSSLTTSAKDVKSTTTKPSTSVLPLPPIRVSAGDNAVLKLPEDKISLYASAWPKEPHEGDYNYLWTQISAPTNSRGYIEGKNTKSVKLSNLKLPGLYTFKLEVKSKDGRHGVGYVNITVKEDRVNHPPRAEIFPAKQEITLPTNTIILDGSKSTDDDAIVSFKWEELGSPTKEKTVFTSTDKKILELKNLVAGTYKFKLTVTDSDGETDSTESEVVVKKEQDYPPEANAGNDVVIRLPNNSVVLNGSKSTDDKGVLTYAWRKTAESPTCDVIGTDKAVLRVSRMLVGTYVFILKVTDSSDQSTEAQVKVVVLPEQNTVPVAVAGDDKVVKYAPDLSHPAPLHTSVEELVYPDSSTTLDGSLSTDNSKIVSYHWEKVSGPENIKMVDANSVKVHITDLVPGSYEFKLTVTDDKELTGSDTVKVNVKKNHNDPPVAVAGKDQVIYLPMRSTIVDGSMSHDDEFIETFHWTRTGVSPAAGKVVNNSDAQAKLQLTDLVKGQYTFELTVTDNKGLTGVDTVVIYVKESPNSLNLVEMYMDVDINKFTEEDKKQLVRKISVLMEVAQESVSVQEISDVGYKRGVRIVFLVNDPNFEGRKYDGKFVADTLKQKVGNGGKLFDLTMQRVEPYVCRNNCSGHGYCDESSKQCVCDAFWTTNIFKRHFGERVSNCDWSVLYLSVVIFGIFIVLIGISWMVCFCIARKKRNKRRARYRALRSTDPDGAEDEILLLPKGLKNKFTVNSLTFTESDDDSDDTTVFDKKQRRNGNHRMNGHANGKVPKFLDEAF